MTPSRWQRLRGLLNDALACETAERAASLRTACGDDGALRKEVESLLEVYEQAGSFLEEPISLTELALPALRSGHSWIGTRLGPYTLQEEIGHGGMSTVFAAVRTDRQDERRVAIKLIRHGMESTHLLRRFRTERQILSDLDHPHIAQFHDGGTSEGGLPYVVMELIEGTEIDTYCDAHQLNVGARLRLFRQVCAAVQYAHRNLIVHRDIKPANILVTAEGVPKLLDFGIAKLLDPESFPHTVEPTATAQRPMTPSYASPEQIVGGSITPATDIYALGVLLHVLLSGAPPYRLEARTPFALEEAILRAAPTRPSSALPDPPADAAVAAQRGTTPTHLRRHLEGDLDTIVLMALRKEPQRRYGSVVQLADDLRRHQAGQPVVARRERSKSEEVRAAPDAVKPTERRIATERLPLTGAHFIGRENELAQLDATWADPHIHVFSIVAWGGAGKSALVNQWLARLAVEDYRGAERVFGWSFYSQGTKEQQAASADPFIDAALRWFGETEPPPAPWERGRRLAELVRQHRTLLILDGLEPMQHPPGPLEGRLKDPALQALVRGLAADNQGLCLITTREAVADVAHLGESTAPRLELERLSKAAGVALLQRLGVEGSEKQLSEAVERFDGHALALTLLGSYLHTAYGGDVRRAAEIPLGAANAHAGGHAFRVIEAYVRWLGEGPKVAILRLLGLFDRPAPGPAIVALRAVPIIPQLTEPLVELSEPAWHTALSHLRGCGLLALSGPENSEALDTHPLVRAYFEAQLKEEYPEAWRKGHLRLYRHYEDEAPDFPDDLEAMMPLFTAVLHGCRAERQQEALDRVYWRRIQRGEEFYCAKKLGALGAEVGALAGFFSSAWERLGEGLSAEYQTFVLNEAGSKLRALGRLREALPLLEAGLRISLEQEEWSNASKIASNLSELSLTLGDLAQAVGYGNQSVELADRSGDVLRRLTNRAVLADGLHQAGQVEESEAVFRMAETMQAARQSHYPLLYSLQGYRYCDLLLGRVESRAWPALGAEEARWLEEESGAVKKRAEKAIGIAQLNHWLLDIALDHLSLGRAHLGLGLARPHGTDASGAVLDFDQAEQHLKLAVERLRQAGAEHHVPRGLIVRAALRRVQTQFNAAERDLKEALEIADRGDMALFRCDAHLEWSRLCFERDDLAKACEHFAVARRLVAKHGYHRRDLEVEALAGVLGK